MREIHRVLEPGGAFYLTVPNPRCMTQLLWRGVFERMGLMKLGEWYSRFTLRLFRVDRVLTEDAWSKLLEDHGFSVERCELYMPSKATRIMFHSGNVEVPKPVTKIRPEESRAIPDAWSIPTPPATPS